MSGLPVLPRGQKYALQCCKCESKDLVPGTALIKSMAEETGDVNAAGTLIRLEMYCQREACKTVSWVSVWNQEDGTFFQWRSRPAGLENGRSFRLPKAESMKAPLESGE